MIKPNLLSYSLKRLCIVLLLSDMCLVAFGQQNNVGIGTASPHASAVLDVAAGNKGILIPRIQLQSETDVATIPSPATGLLVYNLNTVLSDGAGFYYWTGSKWQHLGGRNGTAGKDGAVIYIDDPATPAPGLGKEGDLYIARAGGQYYQKQASGWVQQGELLNAVKLQGRSMLPDAPVDGQALLWDNSQQAWAPKNLPAVAGYTGDRRKGIEINSNHEVSARYDTAMWNAERLKGTVVSGTAPAGGDLLWFNAGSNEWEPGPPVAVTPAWHLGGNAGTDPAADYIGTSDGRDMVFRTDAVERMRLKSNGDVAITPDFKIEGGRVGIGALGADAPQQPLHVKGGVRLEELEALPVAVAGEILLSHGAGDLARSSSLQVKDGNVGIGTATPGYLLTVKGRAGEDPLQLEGLQDAAAGTALPLVVTADGIVKKGQQGAVTPAWHLGGNAGTDPAAHYIGTSDGRDVVFRTDAVERMRLRSNGDVAITPDFKIEGGHVGIDLVGAPQQPLHVNGGVRLQNLSAIPNNVPVDVMTIDGNGDIHKTFDLTVRDYKVGIGTEQPTHRLTVAPNALGEDPLKVEGLHDATDGTELPLVVTADGIVKKGQQASVTPGWELKGNAGIDAGNQFLGTVDARDMAVRTNNKERMRIKADGKVGIGTSTPGNPLTVKAAAGEDPLKLEGLRDSEVGVGATPLVAMDDGTVRKGMTSILSNRVTGGIPIVIDPVTGKLGIEASKACGLALGALPDATGVATSKTLMDFNQCGTGATTGVLLMALTFNIGSGITIPVEVTATIKDKKWVSVTATSSDGAAGGSISTTGVALYINYKTWFVETEAYFGLHTWDTLLIGHYERKTGPSRVELTSATFIPHL